MTRHQAAGGDAIARVGRLSLLCRGGAGQGICTAAAPDPRIYYAREEKSRHPRAGSAVLRAAAAHASARDPHCLLISPGRPASRSRQARARYLPILKHTAGWIGSTGASERPAITHRRAVTCPPGLINS
jgi:hypothetical protein